jgi:hypothetical protein
MELEEQVVVSLHANAQLVKVYLVKRLFFLEQFFQHLCDFVSRFFNAVSSEQVQELCGYKFLLVGTDFAVFVEKQSFVGLFVLSLLHAADVKVLIIDFKRVVGVSALGDVMLVVEDLELLLERGQLVDVIVVLSVSHLHDLSQ